MPGASVMTIASFPTSTGDGTDPDGQLFMDSNGDLFGATVHGGTNDIGTTYEIAKVAGGFSTTPSFLADIPTGLNTLLGVPNLSADANGDLFGLEITGGTGSLGAVVEFPAAGGGPNIVANFAGGAGGAHPGGVLLVDASGNLFGTTASGGAHSAGTVFEIQNTASGYATTPTVLTSFGSGVTPNGAGNLVEDAAGDLFGTTTADTVFEVQKTGSSYAAPIFISFPAGTQIGGSLTIDANGDIFGTTISGGANNDGTVFEIVKNTSTPITLASFSLADGELSVNRPKTLIVDSNGDLFGTTDPSTQNSGGVVFEIAKTSSGYDSTPTIVINFNGSGDGALGANLVADADGDLFGTTQTGGANNTGSVFEITNSGFVVLPTMTAGAAASYVAAAPAVALDPGLSVNGLTLTEATVSISAGHVSGDTLTVGSPQGGITSSYNATTGVLTLTGDVSPATYQAELESVTFHSASAINPSNRTISWSVTDTNDASAQATSSVAVFVSSSDLNINLQNTSGRLALWQVSGATPVISAAALLDADPGSSWLQVGTGSFFSGGATDGSDILLQNTNGSVAVWQMQGATLLSSDVVANPGPNWQVEGTGDFNGDGKTDIALQNTNGNVAVWEMSGGQISQSGVVANPGSNWHIEATGDFNGDSKSDIVLQNTNGNVAIWNMNGDQLSQSVVVANPGPSWHVEGTGDFSGDGHTDLLLQNNNGSVAIWEMNGDQLSQGSVIANPGPNWHIASTGDFNQDGTTDIVLQNNNGAVAVWDMDGGQIGQSSLLANPSPAWSVTGNGRHSSIS
jgi:uncharacterized repeat protein (TIGR03803 family)